ncbi:MarC family protein [Rhizobium sp. BK251]|uniref:MarC family protein n=1 Tax=Rhizobium sp. BK251 TaxID=2512125 RepID=UPI0010521502|nr:MarC family protein [Rhizobium sp. BK251]TCL68286.1 multiple antibiotic resistance protein [Rhizobium sp. BK251]
MGSHDLIVSAFTTLLVTVDPPGLAPLFLGVTHGMTRQQRKLVAIRGVLIAFCILTLFALFGATILQTLGISMGAFRIAGGLMLFAIAFEMIFELRQHRRSRSTDAAITKEHLHHIAVFPIATPLIAGPGALSATVLIAGTMDGVAGKLELISVIAAVMALVVVALFVAQKVDKVLGVSGRALLTRLLGVLLAALSIQFIVDGIHAAFGLR